ncbi:MAG: glycosyltransferase family 2 protein [Candidatus Bathyarchaeia archaeon]|nr:glycosyltransferase family 2 protein [Candidatus Bathyarchaeia archaeon]
MVEVGEHGKLVGVSEARAKPFVVVGIPAFNEEKTIAKVVLKAQKYADKVVVCDDGSKDLTAEIAERLGAEVIRHDTNLGYGAAIQSLFRRARELNADVMVTLDADGQHDPREIPALLKPVLKDEADVAAGSRFLDKERRIEDMPLYRRLGVKAITRLTGVAMNHELSDAQHGFRAYGRKALEWLKLSEDGMGVSVEILLKAREQGLRVVEVPVRCSYRGLETSTRGPLRHGVSVVMSIVRLVVEERPLLFLGVPGVVSLMAGIMFGFWMFQIYIAEHHIVTNIALASIAFVMIGMFSIFTAITLYAITRLTRRISQQ